MQYRIKNINKKKTNLHNNKDKIIKNRQVERDELRVTHTRWTNICQYCNKFEI